MCQVPISLKVMTTAAEQKVPYSLSTDCQHDSVTYCMLRNMYSDLQDR